MSMPGDVAPHPTKIPDEHTADSQDAPASPMTSTPLRWTVRQRWSMTAQAGAALLLIALAVVFSMTGIDDRNERLYQLTYVLLLSAGGLLGMLFSRRIRRPGYGFNWDTSVMLGGATILSMLMMQPLILMMILIRSTPPWIDSQRPIIILVDLGLIVLGALIGLLGYLFSSPLGWLVVLVTAAMMAAFVGMALTTPATHSALVGMFGGG